MPERSKYSTDEQIKRCTSPDADGPSVYMEGNIEYKLKTDVSMMYIGTTGTGKSNTFDRHIINSIDAGSTTIVFSSKRDEMDNTIEHARKQGVRTYVIDFQYLAHSIGFNALRYPLWLFRHDNLEEYGAIINDLVKSIIDMVKDMFDKGSRAFLSAAIKTVIECDVIKEEEKNFTSVFNLFSDGQEKEYDRMSGKMMPLALSFYDRRPELKDLRKEISDVFTTANETSKGFISTIISFLSEHCINNKVFEDFIGSCINNFEIADITGDEPFVLYVITNNVFTVYDPILTTFISQLVNHFIYLANKVYRQKQRLPVNVNIMFDDFFTMPKISGLPNWVSTLRSKGVKFTFVLQSLYQLQSVYGAVDGMIIMENCDSWLVFKTNDYGTSRYISELCGMYDDDLPLTEPMALMSVSKPGQALILIKRGADAKYWIRFPKYVESEESIQKLSYETENNAIERRRAGFDFRKYIEDYDLENEESSGLPDEVDTDFVLGGLSAAFRNGTERRGLNRHVLMGIDQQLAELRREELKSKAVIVVVSYDRDQADKIIDMIYDRLDDGSSYSELVDYVRNKMKQKDKIFASVRSSKDAEELVRQLCDDLQCDAHLVEEGGI